MPVRVSPCSGRKPLRPDNRPRSHRDYYPIVGFSRRPEAFSTCLPSSTGLSDTRTPNWHLRNWLPPIFPGHLSILSPLTLPSTSLALIPKLLAENTPLRQQLVTTHREVGKRRVHPSRSPLARFTPQHGLQLGGGPSDPQARHAPALALSGLPAAPALHVLRPGRALQGRPPNHRSDPTDGQGEQFVVSRMHPANS